MKKNIFKKSLATILCIVFLLTSAFSTYAYATAADLSDPEFQRLIVEIMLNYENDPQATRDELATLGIELLQEPSITHYTHNGNGIQPYGINPTDYDLSVYAVSQKTATNVHILWSVNSNRSEWFSGPLDFASIEYDSNVGSYKASDGDDAITTVQGKNTGVVVFNVEDSKLSKGTYAYGSVNVTVPRGKRLHFGCRYVHTYTSFLVSGSASYEFKPSTSVNFNGTGSLGLSYTMGMQVSVATNTSKWERWLDNWVSIPT